MLTTFDVNTEIAIEFFDNEVLFESSRIDGYTQEDLARFLADEDYKYVASAVEGKLAAITAYESQGIGLSAEVHTFVLPEYRKHSVAILKSHIKYLKDCGFIWLFTTCANFNKVVMNFLIKRLGFTIYDAIETNETRDGEKVVVLKLKKVTNELFQA